MEEYLRVVVAGEVDSGKSTLIGRFLYETGSLSEGVIEEIENVSQKLGQDLEFAYLLDSFEEERRNQLTIDTTQAYCKSKKGRQFIFIDVPGHKELLKNMLCGSSYADMAIVVVDVRKSIEEQTKRHAFILKFLGIEEVILAINKMDTVSFGENIFNKAKGDIIGLFGRIGLQPKHFIPISAKEGDGLLKKSKKMPWYKGLPLAAALNDYSKIETKGDLRFALQDIYTIMNERIATGKIISGEIKRGERVAIMPSAQVRRVKKIKVFTGYRARAAAPESIGLILDEMDGLRRGQIICNGRMPEIKTEILARIFCLRPLNIKEKLKFKCATQESCCSIKQIKGVWDSSSLGPKPEGSTLEETDITEAIIASESPLVIESPERLNSLGRFVLKVNREICAVGINL